ncbi:MAG: Dockerin type domain, partial [Planctomycetota bacterium]
DLDGDGAVGGSDLGAWLVSFGESCDPDDSCPGDFDGDGEVSGGDLRILLAAWGACP